MKSIALGALVGLFGAFWLAQAVASQLYGVSPKDPTTYAAVALVLIGSGLTAAYFPARRAARLEVTEVLREN